MSKWLMKKREAVDKLKYLTGQVPPHGGENTGTEPSTSKPK